MHHHLRRRGPVVLHHVPVLHARRARQGVGEHAQVPAHLGRLVGRGVGEFRAVGARAEEEVAAG